MEGSRIQIRLLPLLLAVIGVQCLTMPQSLAQTWFQPWLGIDPEMTPSHCTQPVGGRCALVCPASDGQKGYIEGTDTYSSYSSICAAAIHAGVLPRGRAGVVVIVIGASPASFRGSERNGVTSLDHGPRSTSFTFATDGAPGSISWQTAWSHVPADFADPVTVTCPAGGDAAGKIWGTDVYTVDSMICVAAVHAGVITANGGAVTVKRTTGLRQYTASERFGIASKAADANADAFSVAAATTTAGRQGERTSTPGIAPRTIQLTGFTAAGNATARAAAAVPPRTIRLVGFTAAGSAPSGSAANVAPRTITTAGWTASGATAPP